MSKLISGVSFASQPAFFFFFFFFLVTFYGKSRWEEEIAIFASLRGQLHSSSIGTWAWQAGTGTPTLELIGFSAGGDLIRATWYSSRPSHCPCCRKQWNLTCAGKEPGYTRKDASTLGKECRFKELADSAAKAPSLAWLARLQLRFHQLLL